MASLALGAQFGVNSVAMTDLTNNHGNRGDDGDGNDGNDGDSRRVRGRLLGGRPALSVNLGLPTVRSLNVAFRFLSFSTFFFQ